MDTSVLLLLLCQHPFLSEEYLWASFAQLKRITNDLKDKGLYSPSPYPRFQQAGAHVFLCHESILDIPLI